MLQLLEKTPLSLNASYLLNAPLGPLKFNKRRRRL